MSSPVSSPSDSLNQPVKERKEESSRESATEARPSESSLKTTRKYPSFAVLFIAGLVFGSTIAAWILWEKAYYKEKISPQMTQKLMSNRNDNLRGIGITSPNKIENKETTVQNTQPQPLTVIQPPQILKPNIGQSVAPLPVMPSPLLENAENVLAGQKDLAEKISDNTQALQTIEHRLARLELGFQTLPLVQSLERSLQKGIPFATTLDVLTGLRPEIDIPLLNKYAQKGLPTEGLLVQEGQALLKQAYQLNLQNMTATTDYKWINFIIHQLSDWVDIRPTQPQLGSDRFSILSRMEAALKEKDYDRLLDEADHLDDLVKPVFQTWLEKIDEVQQVYREFESFQKSFLQPEQENTQKGNNQ